MINVQHFNDTFTGSASGTPTEMISLIDQKNKPALFLININFCYPNIRRTDNAGIMLLKHLRLYGYRQHCLIYSFLSREQLMSMDWRNLIIFSDGVTFIRMPYDLKAIDYAELSKKKAPEDLSAFFKAEFQLPDKRHFFANWWGVLRLWQVHKLLLNGNDTVTIETTILEHARTEMMSYQGLMAQYIFGINKGEIEKSLAAISMRMKQECHDDLENDRAIVNRSLEEVEIALTQNQDTTRASGDAVSGSWFAALKTSFLAFIGRCKKERMIDDAWQKLEAEKQAFVHRQQQLDEQLRSLKDELNEITNTLPDEERPASSYELSQVLNTLRGNVANNNPTILYIDDQANEGWQQIFAQILFDGENEKFFVYQPTKEKTKNIINRTVKLIRQNKPDLIMLDLRLSPEDEHSKDVADVSGIKVLHNIRKEFTNTLCPVLVVSASNKLWSYKSVLASGADAYWMKEGMDVNQDAYGSSNNYARLLSILDALLFSEHYRQLKEIRKIYEQISMGNTPYWWEGTDWVHRDSDFADVKPTRKDTVLATLSEAIQMMKNKLAKELFIENRIAKSVDYQVAVVGRLFKIIEDIHKTREEHEDGSTPTTTLSRKIQDQLFGKYEFLPGKIFSLIKLRNSAIHAQYLTVDEFGVFVKHLAFYLTNSHSPQKRIQPADTIDNPENKVILSECVSQVTKVLVKRKEILLSRPDNMPDHITCGIIVPITFFDQKSNNIMPVGSRVKYKLTLRKINERWIGFPTDVEVVNDVSQ